MGEEQREQKAEKGQDEDLVDAKEDGCEIRLSELETDLKRVAAEFDNYKKRVEREKQQARIFERSYVLSHFLILKDEFEQAASHEDSDGLRLLHKKLDSIFKSLEIKEVDCSKDCDHKFHEVMLQVPGGETGKIAQVIRKGYMMGEILLRPAQVSIYSGKQDEPEEKQEEKKEE